MKMEGRQLVLLTSLYISYTMYVYVRRSFAYVSPVLAAEGNLDKSQLGLITSSHSVGYTISKFVCGVLVDTVSPSLLLSTGLVLSGITAICFTGFESSVLLSFWWFLNGLSQGPGWPAVAIILKNWCAPDQFGTTWSIISTSMNLAGTIGPLATTLLVSSVGWKQCIQFAGAASVITGFISFVLVKNKPKKDSERNNDRESEKKESSDETKSAEDKKGLKVEDKKNESKSTEETISRTKLLFVPGFLSVCFCYMATAIVQYGVLYWGQLFIVQERSQSLLTGSAFISSVDVGGIVGSFLAGYMSDHMIAKNPGIPRHLVRKVLILYFLAFLAVVMYTFTYLVSAESVKVFITLIGFGIGVGIYGPISVFGVVAIESAPNNMAGTAHAIAGLFSNVGIMAAGLPLSFVAGIYNWQTAFLLQSTIVVVMVIYLFFKLRTGLSSYKFNSVLFGSAR